MLFSIGERRLLWFFFTLVTIVALVSRLYGFGDTSLRLDELKVVEAILAHGNLWDVIKYLFNYETHVPFYYVVQYFNLRMLGTSDFVVRLPGLFFSLLSFWELAQLSRSFFNRRNILIYFILVAVSPLIVFYSRDAMMYSMLFWGGCRLIRQWFLLEENPERVHIILGYVLISVIIVYTHYYGILLAGSLFLIALLPYFRTFSIKRHILIHLPSIVCLLFWLVPFVKGLGHNFWWQDKSTTASFYDVIYATSTTISMFIFYLSLIIIAFYMAWTKREKGWIRRASFLVLLVLVSLTAAFLKSFLFSPSVQAKYLLVITAPFIILVGMCIPRVVQDRLLFYLTCVGILFTLSLETIGRWSSFKRSLSRLITMEIVKQHRKNSGSLVLTRGLYPLYFPEKIVTPFYRHNAYDYKDKNIDIVLYESGYDTVVFGYELKQPSVDFYKIMSSKYDLCSQQAYWSYGEPAGVQIWKKKCY